MHACLCVWYMFMCWRPEVSLACGAITLWLFVSFKIESHWYETWVHRILLSPLPQCWDHKQMSPHSDFFTWILGIIPEFSCLQRNLFTNWAVSPALNWEIHRPFIENVIPRLMKSSILVLWISVCVCVCPHTIWGHQLIVISDKTENCRDEELKSVVEWLSVKWMSCYFKLPFFNFPFK